jgi:hypothetical protein
MVRNKKDKNKEILSKRENIRNSARKKRAESIKQAKSQNGNIGENIDLFLEVHGETKNREISAPLTYDQHELRKAGENGINLPPKFNRTKIVLFTRDPEWIYTYWEITREKLDKISDFIGADAINNSQTILRVYDVTDIKFDGNNSNDSFDIEIEGKVSNWYIRIPNSDREYCVEIGLRTVDGKFIRIARSNQTIVPRSGISDSDSEKWSVRESDFVKLYEIAGGTEEEILSGEISNKIMDGVKSGKNSPIPNKMEHLSSDLIYMPDNFKEDLSSASLGKIGGSSETFYNELNENEILSSEALYSGSLTKEELSSGALYSGQLMRETLSSEVLSSEVLSSENLSSGAFSSEDLSSAGLQLNRGKLSEEAIEKRTRENRLETENGQSVNIITPNEENEKDDLLFLSK